VDQNDLIVVEDLVDDAIVTAARTPESFEYTNQRLGEPIRVVRNRPEYGFQCSVSHLVREFVETAETLSRDLDLVHPATSNVVPETHPIALFSIPARTAKRLHQLIVFQDVEGLFEGLEVIGTQEDERWSSIASDQDAVVLTLDPVGHFR
jgi:hypothetical protein